MAEQTSWKQDFPLLADSDMVYLDSAATTQRPAFVLDKLRDFYQSQNANPHRGIYDLSMKATVAYESARAKVAKFLNASEDAEIIFTKNATESLNLLATSYGMSQLQKGDKVVLSIMEHHSNLVPWQQVCKSKGATLDYLYLDQDYRLERLKETITEGTKLVSITHISNALGVINPIEDIIARAHQVGAVVVVDGSQSVPHMAVDVQALDVDFLVFSGHKLMAPLGIGVVYGKKKLLKKMPPFLFGGDMIETVTEQETTFAPVPQCFEAGTQNVGGAVGLHAAIDYLESIGWEKLQTLESQLLAEAKARLQALPYVELYCPQDNQRQIGVISFNLRGIHAHDVAEVLNSENVCIRVGHHCAQPLMKHIKVQSTCRISFYVYNTMEDVNRFIDGIEKTYARFEKWL